RRRHTRFSRDWSSDVCSSDLTDIELLGQKLGASLAAFEQRSGQRLKLWFEPGKFLVSESGYLVAAVNVIKETPSTTFAGLNTGRSEERRVGKEGGCGWWAAR